MNIAAYIRVSTDQQTAENQTAVLKKWALDRGWELAEIYCDTGSAFQYTDQRELKRLLADCDKGKYKQVLVYDLSRLTRKGPLELMLLLKQFADKGAPVFSYSESAINFPSEFQPLFIAFIGIMARIFSTQLSARTKAGMARAKAQGKHIGRPRKSEIQKLERKILQEKMKAENSVESKIKKLESLILEIKTEKGMQNNLPK